MIGEYFGALISVCTIAALGSYAAYNPSDKMTRAAVSVILLYTAALYAVGIAEWVSELDVGTLSEEAGEVGDISDSDYAKTARLAFIEGIKRAVAEKFDISEQDFEVSVQGFDLEAMRAERIEVVLSKATLADYRAVEEYLRGCGIGECSVEVRFG